MFSPSLVSVPCRNLLCISASWALAQPNKPAHLACFLKLGRAARCCSALFNPVATTVVILAVVVLAVVAVLYCRVLSSPFPKQARVLHVMASGDLHHHQHTRDYFETSALTPSLLDLLANTLVLYQTVPYLPISAILNLAATSRSFRHLLHGTPGVFRHLDLTQVTTAQFDIDGVDHGGEIWRNVQVDENLTEDDFYSGPLRGIFSGLRRRNILQHVGTLVLDGLSVTSEFLNDILIDPSSSVRILSIREVKNLNERKLMQALRYACRPTRQENMPQLKAIYYFGKRDEVPPPPPQTAPAAARPSRAGGGVGAGWNHRSQHALRASIKGEGEGEGEDWYSRKGRTIGKPVADGWAETLLDCRGALRFDAVLCTGPRHRNSPAFGRTPITPVAAVGAGNGHTTPWGVATFAVGGCASCGSAPEGFTTYDGSPREELPLLSPVPLHSSSVKSATRPAPIIPSSLSSSSSSSSKGDARHHQQQQHQQQQQQRHEFVPRCLECIRERYCFSCNQWWCEACYQVPSREELAAPHVHIVDEANGLADHEIAALGQSKFKTPKIARSCWECEHNCLDCIAETQKRCQGCGGGYCIIHHEGSTLKLCDWCSQRGGRRCPELY